MLAAAFALAAAVTFAALARGAGAWRQADAGGVVRLRSFAPGASGRLEIVPGARAVRGRASAARVRLTAEQLPRPDVLTPDARAFVVWATGGRVVRLGVLRRGVTGAGALEFAHPAGLARYGLVVTAELTPDAARPTGAPVLATRALEISTATPTEHAPRTPARDTATNAATRARRATETARPRDAEMTGTRDGATTPGARPGATTGTRAGETTSGTRVVETTSGARRGEATSGAREGAAAGALALTAEVRSKVCAGRVCGATGFDAEVNGALAGAGARTLRLVGARWARGWARVNTRGGAAYARLNLRGVPAPARYGARRHVLWAVTDDAGPVYMGSLPETGLTRSPAYARTEGVADRNFRLLVTAEKIYPAARPSGRRVLATYRGRRRRR